MNSLKRPNHDSVELHRARPIHRSNTKMRPRRPRIKQERKRNKRVTKEDEIAEKDEMVAPLQLEQMPLKPWRAKRRSNMRTRVLRRISLKSPALFAIRKATTPEIVPSQKTSCSFGNLYVGDC